MANFVLSPNMSLPVPVVGVDPGPDYATNLNNSLSIIDAHTHTNGSGVPITPDAININQDLFFNGFGAVTLKYTAFSSQASPIAGSNFTSVVGGNLYFNDGSGNQIPITSGGGVAGSPGSIGSLTAPASATYSAGSKTFTWLADSSKSAAMDHGASIIRETNVASAKGVTIASASSLAADYQLTLPAGLPVSTQYFTSNSSGAMSFSTADTIGSAMTSVGSNSIGSVMTSTGANAILAARTRTVSTSVGVGGIAKSLASGAYSQTSNSFLPVTNLSVTITTTGNPIWIGLVPNMNGSFSYVKTSKSGVINVLSEFAIADGLGNAALFVLSTSGATSIISIEVPPSSFSTIDFKAAGTYTYTFQVASTSGETTEVNNCLLVAYEQS